MENDETVTETDELEGQPITVEDGQPESSPDQDPNLEEKRGVQKRINEITAKRYQEQRRADEESRRADAAEAKLRELEAAQNTSLKPAVSAEPTTEPKLPEDPYDTDAMAQYHRQVIEHSAKVARETAKKAFEDNQAARIQEKLKAEQQQQIAEFAGNAIRDGVDLDKLRAAEGILVSEGISPELVRYVMADQNGGKIAVYLHDNPIVRNELLRMDPVSAGIKIATEIKPQVLSTTPKVTGAPEPIKDIKGGGAEVKDEFERKYPDTVFI